MLLGSQCTQLTMFDFHTICKLIARRGSADPLNSEGTNSFPARARARQGSTRTRGRTPLPRQAATSTMHRRIRRLGVVRPWPVAA
eukprot:COSAG02_NODE_30196_length_555_cov_1.491228_1_plen_84_part_10